MFAVHTYASVYVWLVEYPYRKYPNNETCMYKNSNSKFKSLNNKSSSNGEYQ